MSVQTDEPRGRWEDRCDYVWIIDRGAYMTRVRFLICDRPQSHAGLHTGRLVRIEDADKSGGTAAVIGYAKRPQ